MNACYLTGTDTGIGKTVASVALLNTLRGHGHRAVGMKPVASGCDRTAAGLRNADAEALLAASRPQPAYADVNPYAFEAPIAPHLAALDAGTPIVLAPIDAAFRRLAGQADRVVVEGVGGWMAPLSETLMQADLARALALPVVLVVGMRLGCINHALLTARAITADGCRLAGWIANRIDPAMERADDNIASLTGRLPAPLLGVLDRLDAPGPPAMLDPGFLR
ncbi:dethiobiotin synthase [Dokdonella koreensis]|uniref:ATP-dependent dethiobiotin synthetase BioD n=1 Tax=Dokdonella koreensis DS-123 TaxID=1300342 RepID=A0A160DYI7_9GAMM|nr:dethiobiotin synthase [Dokdonella koreensis]ANB19113.1 Dethiobiotin synthetase [Dokdonella koreensis DS-123]